MAIQCLCLAEFLTIICHVDETAVLLPYKMFYALNGEVFYEPDKLGQSFMAASKYFQGFHSQHLTENMYLSMLVGFDSTQEDFYKSLHPEMENLSHQVYNCSIQAPFISKIGWLVHSHEPTNLPCLTEILEGILCHLNPNGPTIALGFQFKNIRDGNKTPKASIPTISIPPLHHGKYSLQCL